MRDSLLRGIAAGVGVGFIRGLRVGEYSTSTQQSAPHSRDDLTRCFRRLKLGYGNVLCSFGGVMVSLLIHPFIRAIRVSIIFIQANLSNCIATGKGTSQSGGGRDGSAQDEEGRGEFVIYSCYGECHSSIRPWY